MTAAVVLAACSGGDATESAAPVSVVETTTSQAPVTTAPPTTVAVAATTAPAAAPTTLPAPAPTTPPTAAPVTTAAATSVSGAGDEGVDAPLCMTPPVPAGATIGTEILFDFGSMTGNRAFSYVDSGTWKLRVEFGSGVTTEIVVPTSPATGVRPIGLADVDDTRPGDELFAVVGGGASALEVGVFGFRPDGCIERYQGQGGGDFTLVAGASTNQGEGLVCGPGYIATWGYQLDAGGTYSAYGAAFEAVSEFVFGYIPASDDFLDGLSFEEVSGRPVFDCNGLAL